MEREVPMCAESGHNFEALEREPARAWNPGSWRDQKGSSSQLPVYRDEAELARVVQVLHGLPPLVHPKECDKLRELLARASRNECFVLWGGDCAEEFRDCNALSIETKFKVLLQMSLVLIYEGRKPVVRIGRMAGQYGKPRTTPTETLADGTVVTTYKVSRLLFFFFFLFFCVPCFFSPFFFCLGRHGERH